MRAHIKRLFACCTSAPDDGPATKMNGMPLPLDTVVELEELPAEHTSDEQTNDGDEYEELVAEGSRHASREEWRRAARAFREAIALRPDEAVAHLKLGVALSNSSWHDAEAAQLFTLRRSSKKQLDGSTRPFEPATSDCDGFLIDLDGTMYQPGGLLPGAREFYRWLVDSGKPYVLRPHATLKAVLRI